MSAHISAPIALFLAFTAAVGYAVATYGMKAASGSVTLFAIMVMAIGFATSAISEVVLMRHANLSMIYITIIAVESLMVISYAYAIGEGFTRLQLGGAASIMFGLVLILR